MEDEFYDWVRENNISEESISSYYSAHVWGEGDCYCESCKRIRKENVRDEYY